VADPDPRYCKYSLESGGLVKLQYADGGYTLERLTLNGNQLTLTLVGVCDGVHGCDSVSGADPWTYTRLSK